MCSINCFTVSRNSIPCLIIVALPKHEFLPSHPILLVPLKCRFKMTASELIKLEGKRLGTMRVTLSSRVHHLLIQLLGSSNQ
jgi:hypothetical protein